MYVGMCILCVSCVYVYVWVRGGRGRGREGEGGAVTFPDSRWSGGAAEAAGFCSCSSGCTLRVSIGRSPVSVFVSVCACVGACAGSTPTAFEVDDPQPMLNCYRYRATEEHLVCLLLFDCCTWESVLENWRIYFQNKLLSVCRCSDETSKSMEIGQ